MRLLGLALLASCVEGQDGIILEGSRSSISGSGARSTRARTRRAHGRQGRARRAKAWTVRSKRDVVRGELIYNKAKRVRRRLTVQGNVSVVLKGVGRHDVALVQ